MPCFRKKTATTEDHVLAWEFFLVEDRQNVPKATACWNCNNGKSKLEDYLTAVLAFGGRHPQAVTNLESSVPDGLAKNRKLNRSYWAPLAGQRRHSGRDRRLPAARAGPRRCGRPDERSLLARRAALRDAQRPAAVPGRRRSLDHLPAPARRSGPALPAQPGRSRGPRPGGARPARQASRGSSRQCGRGPGADARTRSRRSRRRSRRRHARIPWRASPAACSSGASESSSGCARQWMEPSPGADPSSCSSGSLGSARRARRRSSRPMRE